MKLVLIHDWSDGYTCGGTLTIPIEYESVEALQTHILENAETTKRWHGWAWSEFGHEFEVNDYIDYETGQITLPDVHTIDEWYRLYSRK